MIEELQRYSETKFKFDDVMQIILLINIADVWHVIYVGHEKCVRLISESCEV